MIDLTKAVAEAVRRGTDDDLDYAAYILGFHEPNFPLPAIIYDVLIRPLGVAITRDWDGPDGNRFSFEREWFFSKELN